MAVDNETAGATPTTGAVPTTLVTPIPNLVWELPTVGLSELNDLACLQTRLDRKYLLPLDELTSFLTQLVRLDDRTHDDCSLDDPASGERTEERVAVRRVRVLEIEGSRSFGYRSVYFDTPELQSYFDAAQGRPRRCKIRTRTYVDSRICSLEVKTRDGRDQTVKQRLLYPVAHQADLTSEGRDFIGGIEGVALDHRVLVPVMTTHYQRSTMLLGPSLVPSSSSRLTIDTGLRWTSPAGGQVRLLDHAVLETKTSGKPSEADRLLWARHIRPVKISKYCTGLAAMNPQLPANKWNRVLRTHFDWVPQRGSLL